MIEYNIIWLKECLIKLKMNNFGVEKLKFESNEMNC
jgi:hypothetical protein